MHGLRLSVVVPTYNRRERLERVLQALAAQTVSPELLEVVVVDDGSSDGTAARLASLSTPFALVVKSQANGGPAVARNTGILAASGEKVLFLDDDVVPDPVLVEEHLRVHDAEPGDVVVLGTLSSLPHYAQPWVAWEQVQVEKQYTAMTRGDYAPSYRQFWTGNASVSRAHLIEAGLFDVTYLRGEDVELGRRLAQRGLEFRFNPRARGLHHAERSLASWCHAHESYGRLEVEIFREDPTADPVALLAGNWSRLRRPVRGFLRGALAVPGASAGLEKTLRRALENERMGRAQRVTGPLCSVLANLLYWRASRDALGAERFSAMLRLADEYEKGLKEPT